MAPANIRKSPAIIESQNSQASSSLTTLASHAEIPSTSDLTQLAISLTERNVLLTRRRRNLKSDENRVLQGKGVSSKDNDGFSLTLVLDQLEEQIPVDVLPVTTKASLGAPLASANRAGQAASPSPRPSHLSASPAPSSTGQGTASQQNGSVRTKIKIKRDPDRLERERSESVLEIGSTPAAESVVGEASESTSRPFEDSPAPVDLDWDEEAPTRPGRTYQSKRKRQRTSQTKDHDEISQSETGSPAAPSTSQRPSPQRESSISARLPGASLYTNGSGPSLPTIKLKLNPTAHTAPMRTDALNQSMRRPSSFRGREDFVAVPMTPMQASQAAMWELPKRTSDTFIPKPATLKQIRTYPIRPEDVDVDFAKMDWRERDKERDRLEAAATITGPGPGQAIIKEGTAASRARDRKQDQVAHHTFQQWTDGWFRTLTEEDLAWVSSKSDELDAFQFPSLGRRYTEVWEEEEANGALIPTVYLPSGPTPIPSASSTTIASTSAFATNGNTIRSATSAANGLMNGRLSQSNSLSTISETPRFDPRNLKDDHLYGGSSEDVRSGPFTERLLAALLPTPPSSAPSLTDVGTATSNNGNGHGDQRNPMLMNGLHFPSGSSASRPQDMAEFEERLRRELKAIDVLGDEEIDWSDRADDEISSTLRTVQRLLRKQIRVNEIRKTRLFEIAMDRMAYQEYLGCLNSVEREIEAGWMKRQTQIKKSMQAQKKKKGNTTTTTSNGVPAITALASSDGHVDGSPAATTTGIGGAAAMTLSSSSMGITNERGGGPIPPQFTESLLSAIEKRKQLKFAIEPLFADKPLAKDTPAESVYRDLDLDI